MDKQKTFDVVARHLLKQGCRATTEEGMCQYRDEYGRKCAIGILIPEDRYSPSLEGRDVKSWSCKELEIINATLEDVSFLQELQRLHDGFPVSAWPEKLFLFANWHDIRWSG